MNSDEQSNGGNYGVPRDIYAKVKYGMFIAIDLAIVGGSLLGAFMLWLQVFPPQKLLQMLTFIFLTPIMVGYLLLPHNGGKKNWQAIYIYLRRRKKMWISFDWRKDRNAT